MRLRIFTMFFLITSFSSLLGSESGSIKLLLKVSPQEYDLYIGKQLHQPQSVSGSIKEYLIPLETDRIFLRSQSFRDKYLWFPTTSVDILTINPTNVFELKRERL